MPFHAATPVSMPRFFAAAIDAADTPLAPCQRPLAFSPMVFATPCFSAARFAAFHCRYYATPLLPLYGATLFLAIDIAFFSFDTLSRPFAAIIFIFAMPLSPRHTPRRRCWLRHC
jgi:hypothetical protein